MPGRKNRDNPDDDQLGPLKSDKPNISSDLPSFASTVDEIKTAVEQNAIDRGQLLLKVIVSLQIDTLLDLLDQLSQAYDKEDFYQSAEQIGIKIEALRYLDQIKPPVPYPYYFCTPKILMKHPRLVFYYRNVAMLSRKVMRGIGLNTSNFEEYGSKPTAEVAHELASYFNRITSNLILESDVSPYRHIMMMAANIGDSLGGTSRNEVGRVGMMRVINPLIRYLHAQGRLSRA